MFFLARLFCLLASPLTFLFYKGLNLISTYKDSRLKITLEESGVATMVSTTAEGEVMMGTWVKGEEENTVMLTFDGAEQKCICDGKTLTIEVDGAKVVLEK